MLSPWMAICDGNPLVSGEFPELSASDLESWCFIFCKLEQSVGNIRVFGDLRRLNAYVESL